MLHTDRRFLPGRPAAHASWNYVADPDTAQVAVTYSMTRLQGLPDAPYLVTLNPRTPPRGAIHEAVFEHPQFDSPRSPPRPRCRGSPARTGRTTPARTSASASTRTACAPASSRRRARPPTSAAAARAPANERSAAPRSEAAP